MESSCALLKLSFLFDRQQQQQHAPSRKGVNDRKALSMAASLVNVVHEDPIWSKVKLSCRSLNGGHGTPFRSGKYDKNDSASTSTARDDMLGRPGGVEEESSFSGPPGKRARMSILGVGLEKNQAENERDQLQRHRLVSTSNAVTEVCSLTQSRSMPTSPSKERELSPGPHQEETSKSQVSSISLVGKETGPRLGPVLKPIRKPRKRASTAFLGRNVEVSWNPTLDQIKAGPRSLSGTQPINLLSLKCYCCVQGCCHNITQPGARPLMNFKMLQNHYNRKHGNDTFPCRKCGKVLTVRGDQQTHEKHCGKVWNCICGSDFKHCRSLKDHIKNFVMKGEAHEEAH